MDSIDRDILHLLQQNARITIKEIAKQINLTSPAVSDRIRRMEKQEVILGYTVRLNTNYNKNSINALISITVPIASRSMFVSLVKTKPDILKCYHVTGDQSYMMRVRCEDMSTLESLLGQLQQVGHTSTQIILSDMVVAGPSF